MYLNFHGLVKTIRALANSEGLSLVFEDIDMPRTDSKAIYVPTPSPEWSEDEFTLWVYKIYHEIGHNTPIGRAVFEVMEKTRVSMNSLFGGLFNLIEDHRQERMLMGHYAGWDSTMRTGRRIFLEGQLENAKKDPPKDDDQKLFIQFFAWDTEARSEWNPQLIDFYKGFLSVLKNGDEDHDDDIDAVHHALGKYRDKLLSSATAEQSYALTKELLEEVKRDPEEEEKKAKEKSEEEGEEGKKGERGSDGGESWYEKTMGHSHTPKGRSTKPVKHRYDGWETRKGEYIPRTEKDMTVIDYDKTPVDTGKGVEFKKRVAEEADKAYGLSHRLRALLLIKAEDMYEYGLKSGELHSKNLYRVTMKEARGFNEQVFKKKSVNDVLDVSVTVLTDLSGSMGGRKIVNAAAAAIAINEAVSKIGVPVEMLGFSENSSYGPIHPIFKKFHQKVNRDQLLARFADATRYMIQNADGESILWAYSRLAQQPTKRKILIVLSDGSPCADHRGDVDGFTRGVVKAIQDEGLVEIYGIGIMDRNVSRIYKEWATIRESDELTSAVFKVLKKKILEM